MSERSKILKKLRGMGEAELRKEEAELRLAIWKMRIGRATGQTTEPTKLASARRDLARLLTIARERQASTDAGGGR